MKGQYEQQCNAAALKEMGVPVLKKLKKQKIKKIIAWVKNSDIVRVDYPNITESIIEEIFKAHSHEINKQTHPSISRIDTSSRNLQKLNLGNILNQIKG